ncbi:MAG: chromate efflux transporter [Gemmatimonadetes bacterium]|nr:chromate efflux transporter [Gemmatimonadota bacterium]
MEQPSSSPAARAVEGVPNESLGALFVRFLRFGLLAWGGPVAQIAMIREQLVDRERWISRERFHRVLAVYQALPGPEAHELCVYFGMLARGRSGANVAGLGFMLPGFALMLLLSWSYVRFGVDSPLWRGAMLGCQGAVAALIVRAVVRLGQHALSTRRLGVIAVAAAASQFAGANGIVVLAAAGVAHAAWRRARGGGDPIGLALLVWLPAPLVANAVVVAPSIMTLFGSGLRAGLLTFGGAYTAIPFLRSDAVITGRWMTDAQFLDGLALSSVLPAPFIIFSTFVGYLGGGMVGAVVVTAGVFLPAFAFTLVGHDQLERIVETPSTHDFLDGVTAGVVGIIAVTAWSVGRGTLTSPLAVVIFVGALAALFRFRAPSTVAWVMGGAALIGVAARAT